MAATRQNDVVGIGLGRLLAQWGDSPKLHAFVATYLRQVQLLETAAWDVIEAFNLDTGPEWAVAIYGRIVNRGRSSFTLDQFRALIRAQVAINRSRGTIPDLLSVASLMVNSAPAGVVFELLRVGTKHIKIVQSGPAPAIGVLALWSGFVSAKASTTRLDFEYAPSGSDLAFKFSAWPEPASDAAWPVDADHGFGWDDGSGGVWSGDFDS